MNAEEERFSILLMIFSVAQHARTILLNAPNRKSSMVQAEPKLEQKSLYPLHFKIILKKIPILQYSPCKS
jgi:hypothetical protein